MHRGSALIALVLAVAALSGGGRCQVDDPPWTLEHELDLLTPDLARSLSVPCSGYAHVFRRDRHGDRELLAALRVSRTQACTQGVLAAACGRDAEAHDDASEWDARVERLQVRVFLVNTCVVCLATQQTRVRVFLPDVASRHLSARRHPDVHG